MILARSGNQSHSTIFVLKHKALAEDSIAVEKYILQETPTYDFYCGLVGGVSMWFNFLPKLPMDVFAEYRYPLVNYMQTQGFYFGVSFLVGVDR